MPTPAGSPPDRAALDRGLAVAATMRAAATNVTESAAVDRLVLRAQGRAADLPLAEALALGASGHLVDVTLAAADYTLRIHAEGEARPYFTPDGNALTVLPTTQANDLAHAIDTADTAAALRLLADMPVTIVLTVRNDPARTGAHWVRDVATLTEVLTGPEWIAAVSTLAAEPRIIIVDDATEPRTVGAFTVAPQVDGAAVPPLPAPTDADYRAWRGEVRAALPPPTLFAPRPGDGDGDMLSAAFAAVTRPLVWWWLADVAAVSDGALALTVRGAKLVEVTLRPHADGGSVAEDVALYSWATALSDPARMEAVAQAASLAISRSHDVATAAEPVLRTARSLYELARRGAVAEALATRRTARTAAADAARSASRAARDAATKTVERVLLQVGAAAGIIFARAGDLVGRGEAVLLLLILAVVVVASFAVTWCVDLGAAQRGLDAELADLELYRDTLGADDVAAIRTVSAVGASSAALRSARIASTIFYGVLFVAVLAGAWMVSDRRFDKANPAPTTPSPSTAGTPTATTAPSAPTRPPGPLPSSLGGTPTPSRSMP